MSHLCPLGGMVDTTDLKSVGFWPCQFESGSGHHENKGFLIVCELC